MMRQIAPIRQATKHRSTFARGALRFESPRRPQQPLSPSRTVTESGRLSAVEGQGVLPLPGGYIVAYRAASTGLTPKEAIRRLL